MHSRSWKPLTTVFVLGAMILIGLWGAPGARAEGQCGDPLVRPWCNTSLSPDARASLLLAAMTPAERVGMLGGTNLLGVAGGATVHTGTEQGVPSLGVPTLQYDDGPLGPRQGDITGMPSPMADAATWSPSENYAYGQVVGTEARDKGADVIFGPTVNLMRTPLGGRTYEGFGEDPFLVSDTAVSWIDGVQSTGVMADIKHFAENNQEGADPSYANTVKPSDPLTALVSPPGVQGSRMSVNVNVDPRTLHEMELAPFEAAVKQAHVATIMCSYNLVNGVHSCENPELESILNSWGFQGYMISDYGAAHGTAQSLAGGLDFEPWPGVDVYGAPLIDVALLDGQATMAEVDRHVLRILRTWFAYGVFDRQPFTDDPALIPQTPEAATSEQLEENAITLLRNQHNILPLSASTVKSIAVIGAGGSTFVTGGGSGAITPFHFDSPDAAIAARVAPSTTVITNSGSNQASAVAAAKQVQVPVVIVPDYTTEGIDRGCLTFECPDVWGNEDGLIEAVAAANPNTIAVMENSGPILTPWRNQVAGLLEAWYPGQEAGPAIAHVLFGDVDPGGRLPVTFPDSMSQEPTAGNPLLYPGVNNQEDYSEGVFLGYRWFDAHHELPAYPFGYGLSYTSWKLSDAKVKGRTVTIRVRNTGKRTGSTVAELYLSLPPQPGVPQPPWDLRGYQKVSLGPGRSSTVRFKITSQEMAYWNTPANDWTVAKGNYKVYVGFSSQSPPLVGTIRQRTPLSLAP
jgi:beta-glucosidase